MGSWIEKVTREIEEDERFKLEEQARIIQEKTTVRNNISQKKQKEIEDLEKTVKAKRGEIENRLQKVMQDCNVYGLMEDIRNEIMQNAWITRVRGISYLGDSFSGIRLIKPTETIKRVPGGRTFIPSTATEDGSFTAFSGSGGFRFEWRTFEDTTRDFNILEAGAIRRIDYENKEKLQLYCAGYSEAKIYRQRYGIFGSKSGNPTVIGRDTAYDRDGDPILKIPDLALINYFEHRDNDDRALLYGKPTYLSTSDINSFQRKLVTLSTGKR